ncbi:NADP oxidoreductase [Vitiosangium sp. GDMCC 1.1324]|nr:NADP oxidoreductase [Vitiosangium sp. GDMCC 1.1324]
MRIGIIGAGHIGSTAARLFTRAGHEVALSNSRGPDSLASLVRELGPRARAATVDDAARFGELVLLAIPWRTPEGLPSPELVTGKIVIDAMNPYGENFEIINLGDSTSSEEVAKRLPRARLVKAFNTMLWTRLRDEGRPNAPLEERLALLVAGDDVDAKRVVSGLIEQIGFAPVDTGSLREGGRRQQPGSPVYGQPLTRAQALELTSASRYEPEPPGATA